MQNLTESFDAFCARHPDVWEMFERFSLELICVGKRHGSADAVLHRIRWNYETSTQGNSPKLNNNFSPFFARRFMKEHPEHDGFFFLRKSAADSTTHELKNPNSEPCVAH